MAALDQAVGQIFWTRLRTGEVQKMKSSYAIADFRQLVTFWYNEFLPVECKDRFAFVKDAEILYLNSISLEPLRGKTIDFMKKKVKGMLSDGTKTIFVQEPKPVNNVRLKPTLKFLSESDMIDDERKLKVMHTSNRRYVPTSDSILVSQDKEIDEFLDSVFSDLSEATVRGAKFLSSSSLPIQEAIDVASSLFPRKSLSIIEVQEGEPILVKSSNDVMQPLFIQVNLLCPTDPGVDRYVERCRKSLLGEFEKLV